MKIKYISEGVFKNPEQARAAREREMKMSNQERVAGTFNKLINDRINYIIQLAVQKKGIYPFQVSMFSYGSEGSVVKLSKKEVKCNFGIEDGKNVIHLSFDYGKFVVGNKDCAEINLNSWIMNDWNSIRKLRKDVAHKNMVTKIINFIDRVKMFFDKHDQEICDLILGSEIVIDDISMYNEPGDIEEIRFDIHGTQYHISEKRYLADKRNRFVKDLDSNGESNRTADMKVLRNLMELVDFNVPVKLMIEVINYSLNRMVAIESAFPGYKTLGDLEKGVGVQDLVMNMFMNSCKEHKYKLKQEDVESLEKQFNECSFIMFDYVDVYIGRYYKDKGLKIESSNAPVISSVIIGSENDWRQAELCTKFTLSRKFGSNLGRNESDQITMLTKIDQDIYFYNKAGSTSWRADLINMRSTFNDSSSYYYDIKALIDLISKLIGPAI